MGDTDTDTDVKLSSKLLMEDTVNFQNIARDQVWTEGADGTADLKETSSSNTDGIGGVTDVEGKEGVDNLHLLGTAGFQLERGATLRPATTPSRPGAYPVDPRNPDLADSSILEEDDVGGTAPFSPMTTTLEDNIQARSGLAVANLVDTDGEQPNYTIPEARQFDAQVGQKNLADRKRRNNIVVAKVLAFLSCLVIIIVLPVVLTKQRDDSDSDAVDEAATMPPTVPPESRVKSLLPEYTLQALNNPSSPQSEAFTWILGDPGLSEYADKRILQRYVLATFYFSTGGDDWSFNTNWLSYEHHECDWHTRNSTADLHQFLKVERNPLTHFQERPCVGWWNHTQNDAMDSQYDDLETGTYLHLWFWLHGLKGTIPEELYMLTDLRSIAVPLNKLSGTLSTQVGLLTNLFELDIVFQSFRGTFPTELGLLTDADTFFLLRNQFTGTIPSELGLLSTKMRLLQVDNNMLTGTVPTSLQYLSNVEWLYLHRNSLTGAIPSELGKLSNITYLEIEKNPYGGTVPSELGQLSLAERLYVEGCNLTGTLPTELQELTALDRIQISDNKFTGTIPTWIGKLAVLTRMFLDGNFFTGGLPSEFLLLNATLERLNLGFNNITGPIYSELGLFSVLEWLLLPNNQLTGTLPTELGKLTFLHQMHFENNFLSGTIPTEFSHLNATESLDLSFNNISGAIHTEFGQMTSMKQLLLSNMMLTGSVPSELGLMLQLELLNLQGNMLTGTLPAEIFALENRSLVEMDISGNPGLFGTLPSVICNISVLVFDCSPSTLCGCSCNCSGEPKETLRGNSTF